MMDKRDLISLHWKTKLSSIYGSRGAAIARCVYDNRNEENTKRMKSERRVELVTVNNE